MNKNTSNTEAAAVTAPLYSSGPLTVQLLEDDHNGYDNWPTFAIRDERNYCLATVGDVDRATAEKNEGNARLWAAAPELLDGCRKLFALIESGDLVRNTEGDADAVHFLKQGMRIGTALKITRAAIAKAEGRDL